MMKQIDARAFNMIAIISEAHFHSNLYMQSE